MTATNVTPVTPVALPYTYTQNYGQAYEFASLSKQGCVDTVYADTYNGSAYVPGLPVSAAESIQLIQDANQQFGPVFIVCQSLLMSVNETLQNQFLTLGQQQLTLGQQQSQQSYTNISYTNIASDTALLFVTVVFLSIIKAIFEWTFERHEEPKKVSRILNSATTSGASKAQTKVHDYSAELDKLSESIHVADRPVLRHRNDEYGMELYGDS